MIQHYFIVAIRTLLKQKFYTLINILGLSIGLASYMIILLIVLEEFSYDKFHIHKTIQQFSKIPFLVIH